MVQKNANADKLCKKKSFAKGDTSYSSFWLYNHKSDIDSKHFKDSFVNFYDEKELLSEFNYTVAKNIISFWSEPKDLILDPFSGRTRALVAYAMDRKYDGFEISDDVTNHMKKKFKELGIDKKEDFDVKLINDDCLNIDNHIKDKTYDMIFTCPPYWNLERYQSVPGQLSDISDYEEFLVELKARLDKSIEYLKPNGYMAIVVGDFRRNGKYITFHSDMIDMYKNNKYINLHDVIVIQNIPLYASAFYFGIVKKFKMTSKAHEYLLIFKKKGPKEKIEIKKYSIENMKDIAKERGGECLSEEYVNMSTHLRWRCSQGHEWDATPTCVVTRKQWCPKCGKVNSGVPKLRIEDIQEEAKMRGGKLLTTEYVNCETKMLWECKYGHRWETTAGVVLHNKRWCPKCATSYGETLTREIFNKLLNKKFHKVKPEWLKNDEGNLLELDGYNEELKIAFEYNGVQHYKENWLHKKENAFEKQKRHDDIKRERCKEKGIMLINIPYKIKHDKLEQFIKNKFNELGIKYDEKSVSIKKMFKNSRYERFEKRANELGYELLSDYKGNMEDVKLRCSRGHEFTIAARSIARNKGCPICSGYRKLEKDDIQDLCKKHGSEMLDKEYVPGSRITALCTVCKEPKRFRLADIKSGNIVCYSCSHKK